MASTKAPMLVDQHDVEFGTVRLYPQRARFITGVSSEYDDSFPAELHRLVKEEEFVMAINQINNTLADYWPCLLCVCFGYLCCPCTLGASLLCPNFCIRDAESYVRALIVRINTRPSFARAGVEWQFVRTCGQSWIEISFPLQGNPTPGSAYQLSSSEKSRDAGRAGPVYATNSQTSSPSTSLVVEV